MKMQWYEVNERVCYPMRLNKKFSLRYNWNRHRQGDKPFKYKICDKTFHKQLTLEDKLVGKSLLPASALWTDAIFKCML